MTDKKANSTNPTTTYHALAVNHGYELMEQVSTTNLHNNLEVRAKASMTSSEKVEASRAVASYKALSTELKGQIQAHLNSLESKWNNKEGDNTNGYLHFLNSPVYSYIKGQDNLEHISSSLDFTIPYEFFILRYVLKDSARNLEPNICIKTDTKTDQCYQKIDVYKMFEYYKGGSIKIFNQNHKINEQVKQIFKDNADEFEAIIKNVYDYNIAECNGLKDLPDRIIATTCFSEAGRGPEAPLQALLCFEIMHSVNNLGFCPDLSYDASINEDL
jgi:hypothetical protein